MAFPRDLGMISAKYESGGREVDFISDGAGWDPGGKHSYGIWQLSGAYSMGAFLRSKWGQPYASKFAGLKPATSSFNRIYKKVALADPNGFAYAQKAFYATTHYIPLRDHASCKGFNVDDRGVQEALFSMSVQHGGAKKIVNAVVDEGVPSDSIEQIKALYRERSQYVMDLRTLSTRIKNNIVNKRYTSEVRDAIALAGTTDAGVDEEVQPSSNLREDVGDYGEGVGLMAGLLQLIINIICALAGGFTKINDALNETMDQLPGVEDIALPKLWKNVQEKRETPWMATAKNLLGTREIRGKKSNNVIMSWARKLGRSMTSIYTNDDIPWCGLFIAHIMNSNGIQVDIENPLGARNWLKFGEKCDPQYGAVMVFWRGKKSGRKGHVGTYVSEDDTTYHILGGNQSNSVNVIRIAKNRFLGARWPKGHDELKEKMAGRIKKDFDGSVSTNEE